MPFDFEFTDSASTKVLALGRKHRRGRRGTAVGSPRQRPSPNLIEATTATVTMTSLDLDTAIAGTRGNEVDKNHQQHQNQSSCAGSLTYSTSASSSASASVVFAEDESADSSFAEIIKVLGAAAAGGDGENKTLKFRSFMSERTGTDRLHLQRACGMDSPRWMLSTGVEERSKEQRKLRQQELKVREAPILFAGTDITKKEKDDDDVYENERSSEEMNILGTIEGGSEDGNFVNQAQAFQTTTPPLDSRLRRKPTPPGAVPLVGATSRQSRGPSDGSIKTLTPASPPYSLSLSHSKPPAHGGRCSPSSKTRARVPSDIIEPMYKSFWMCGFTDAFNFDGFKE